MGTSASFPEYGPYPRAALYSAYKKAEAAGDQEAMQELIEAIKVSYGGQNGKYPMTENTFPTAQSGMGKFMQGVGVGPADLMVGGANMVGALSNNYARSFRQAHADLDKSWPGYLGEVAGQTAATAPIGGMAGAAAKGVGGVAGRVLPTVINSATGALQGAANADPDKRGTGAAIGGAIPAALGTAGGIASGLVSKSEAAKRLIAAGTRYGRTIFLPIGQAADKVGNVLDKAAGSVYRGVFPFAPFAKGAMEQQSDKAAEDVFNTMADHSMPSMRNGQDIPAKIGKTPQETASNVKQQFADEFHRSVGQYQIPVNPAIPGVPGQTMRDRALLHIQLQSNGQLPNAVANNLADEVTNTVNFYSRTTPGGQQVVDGPHMLRAIDELRLNLTRQRYSPDEVESATDVLRGFIRQESQANARLAQTAGGGPMARAAQEASDNLDDFSHIEDQWRHAAEPWISTVEASPQTRGMPTWSAIARAAHPGSDTQHIAQDAFEVFGDPAASVNPESRHLMNTGINAANVAAGAAGAATGHLPITLGVMGGGSVAARQWAQNLVYGDNPAQQALRQWALRNPQAAATAGSAFSGAGVAGATE